MVAPSTIKPSNKVRVVDDETSGPPRAEDLVRLSEPLAPVLVGELDGAVSAVVAGVEEFLLAALGRAIARTLGAGVVTVTGPTVATRTRLCCATDRELDADGLLADVRRSIAALPDATSSPPDVVFAYRDGPPEPSSGSLQLSGGPALGLLVHHADGTLQMDWWYDARRLSACTVEELAAQFQLGLIELTSESTPEAAPRHGHTP